MREDWGCGRGPELLTYGPVTDSVGIACPWGMTEMAPSFERQLAKLVASGLSKGISSAGTYEIELRHDGLHKYRVIRGKDQHEM